MPTYLLASIGTAGQHRIATPPGHSRQPTLLSQTTRRIRKLAAADTASFLPIVYQQVVPHAGEHFETQTSVAQPPCAGSSSRQKGNTESTPRPQRDGRPLIGYPKPLFTATAPRGGLIDTTASFPPLRQCCFSGPCRIEDDDVAAADRDEDDSYPFSPKYGPC